jgi:hypothetical protein
VRLSNHPNHGSETLALGFEFCGSIFQYHDRRLEAITA